ncbi:MAG TPA: DUF4914 family protein [Candidatus Hydrogenedentes bacterium]|nr:DUF4914 family protein [Candidatus Hydrogenedentota bacterium]
MPQQKPKTKKPWVYLNPPREVITLLENAPSVITASTTEELVQMACGGPDCDRCEVAYDVPGQGRVVEATVARVRNGICVNYPEPYMRRRDGDCMVLGDSLPTDKETFDARFGKAFDPLRKETLDWLGKQDLAVFGFIAGMDKMGMDAMVLAPANAGFFVLGLAMLQGIIAVEDLSPKFSPRLIIYIAPPFRHTHFDGKQVVVHQRDAGCHEIFAYNLYPGPSAKKGVYGSLLGLGEREGWVTAHCSVVQVVTPYDNTLTLMHEGASGGGKSEMLEVAHREPDGRLLLGRNIETGEEQRMEIPRGCALRPVTDDMALCHPSLQKGDGKLSVVDAENAWFVRVNHITSYGTEPHFEALTAQPSEPLLFFNIDAVPGSRALIWEHTQDAPHQPCPNPRVIIPRHIVPDIMNEPVSVDVRSLGVRTPPCTAAHPSYGILGLVHLLPPALSWLWRLVAPRGHDNPSIVDSGGGMSSEGVGSYWPFAPGLMVDHANLLLNQIVSTPKVVHILCPNQYVGAWKTGFMPQWIAREYLARRGIAKFKADQIRPARCPLLGHTLHHLTLEGHPVPRWLLQVNAQPEVGDYAYDEGAKMLTEFFHSNLKQFMKPELHPLGKTIIECCLDGGQVSDYQSLIATTYIATSLS